MNVFLLFLHLLCFFICSNAYQTGAPKTACYTLLPAHSGIGVQNSRAPYTVSAVKQGSKVRIKISSSSGEEFQGFLLQARSANNPDKLIEGEFSTSHVSKATDCSNGRKNTLTHVNKEPKREVTTEWTPRGSVNEDVIFRATVAETYATFWSEIDSKSIRVRGDGSASADGLSSNGPSIYNDCFRTKGCFGFPEGCVQKRDCDVLLSYAKSSDGIQFSMHGYLDSQKYMAMGLSNDASMGDDSVTECYREGSIVKARESWNEGKSNGRNRELSSNRYQGTFSDGLASCHWTKNFLSESNGRRYDLENNAYYILLAKGPTKSGGLDYHTDGRMASGQAVRFTTFQAIKGGGVADAVKIHGTFMVTAWVGFVSIAILLARHFKNTWEDSTLGGVKIWFALHRGFMIVALAFFIIAFIVIFVHKDGWNYETDNPHAILGCIAVTLGVLNPIMALFRPGPDHKNRPIFNWLHFGVGNAAHLIAVITIFYSRKLPSAGLDDKIYWVMAVFVLVHLIFHLLYQVHTWSQTKRKSNDVGMNEMNGSRTNGHNAQNAQPRNVPDNVFRILLLGIYVIFLLAILITLYALIGVAK